MNIPRFPEAKTGKKIHRKRKKSDTEIGRRRKGKDWSQVNRSFGENVCSAVCNSPGFERQAGRKIGLA